MKVNEIKFKEISIEVVLDKLYKSLTALENQIQNSNPVCLGISLPTLFCGEIQDDWLSWLESFELWTNANGFTDIKCFKLLPLFLDKLAFQTYKSTVIIEKVNSYKDLKLTLTAAFCNPETMQYQTHELLCRLQRPDETVSDFAYALSKTSRAAFPNLDGDQRDVVIKNIFLKGLLPCLQLPDVEVASYIK